MQDSPSNTGPSHLVISASTPAAAVRTVDVFDAQLADASRTAPPEDLWPDRTDGPCLDF